MSVRPEQTAIRRSKASSVAQQLGSWFVTQGCRTILDYGCGVGVDVGHYRRLGLHSEGFDPFPDFGWPTVPIGRFDVVTLVYVLNVLADPVERAKALKAASAYVVKGGLLIVSARSQNAIRLAAREGNWEPVGDGYWSNRARGMFQHGMSKEEIVAMAAKVEAAFHQIELVGHDPTGGIVVGLRRG